jgi:hypothetical protein
LEWTYHKIAELAPDRLTLDKARALAHRRRWVEVATDGGLLWGLCKSSGERQYQVVASLAGDALRCECSARQHPCRHALALLLLFLKSSTVFEQAPITPAWAQERLKQAPAAARCSSQEQAQREAARAARFGQRLTLMQRGVEDLEQWLLDLVRQGLATAESQPEAFGESFAARMTDAKLSGLARRIRSFKSIVGQNRWPDLLLGELANLYLFAQGFKQGGSLPEPLQEEIFNLAGVSRKKEELLPLEGLADRWLVAGQIEGESEDDKLRYRRTWLLGEQSERWALLLDFSWGQQGYEANWVAGSAWQGELVFYPGAFPLRALVRQAVPYQAPFHAPEGYRGIADFARAYASALAENPWLAIFPALLGQVAPRQEAGAFWLADEAGQMLPLAAEGDAAWKLLALCGGAPIKLFGEWDGQVLRPIAALLEQRLVSLQDSAPEIDLEAF